MPDPTQRELLEAAKEHIKLQDAEITRLMQPPLGLRTVLKLLPDNQLLSSGDTVLALPGPDELATLNKLRAEAGMTPLKVPAPKPGDLITVSSGGAVIDVIEVSLAGATATVKRIFPDSDLMEIEGGLGNGSGLIYKGLVVDCVKPGDSVQLDRTSSVALRVVPKQVLHSIETATGVSWADIGGQDLAISVLQEAIEGPIKQAKLFKAYNKKPMKGVLMSGPPGCGKTLMAKATANAIREAHGGTEAHTAFIYVKGPEVLDKWVGNTEAHIRALFVQAREHKEEYGYPAVVFIDEADAILGKRGGHHASILSSTIVPTFLAEMDGLVDSGAFVLLATNRPDTLDPAVVREGRIDRKVVVGRPALRESAQILSIHLRKTKVQDEVPELAGTAAAELFSDEHVLYRVGLKGKGVKPFHVRNLVSGALLAGVVDAATSIAIRRDAPTGKASGLLKADVQQAVVDIVRANRNLNHDDDLQAFAEEHGAEIEALQRMAA